MKLESIGKILASGFGDKMLIGVLIGFFDDVTPFHCYEYIRDNTQLSHNISDSDWQKYQRATKGINLNGITSEDIIRELEKRRLDILGVILNHPDGRGWLNRQVIELKKRLSQ